MTLHLAVLLRNALLPFLEITSAVLGVLFVLLLLHRLIAAMREARRTRIEPLYRPVIARLLQPQPDAAAFNELARAPRRHADVIGSLLLAPLSVTTGETRATIGQACARLGFDRRWRARLSSRHWWQRADAARALGAIQDREAFHGLVSLLADEHAEVRAAAVEALGLLEDPRALASLAALLSTPSRYQRARVVEAMRRHGEAAVGALVDRAAVAPQDRLVIADLLGLVRAPQGIALLVEWLSSNSAPLRAAAMQSLGTIGLDERTYYYAVRALGDRSADVRAAAARALGRTGREDAAFYLEPLLDDEWDVAARSAVALQQLGAPGALALHRRSKDETQAGDLARQMLWERRQEGPATA